MIEGLKITVSGHELSELLKTRAAHHESRVETYKTQIQNMTEACVEGMTYSSGDPVKNLRDKQSEHYTQQCELLFIAAHIDQKETYLLDRSDLVKLGISKSMY